MDPLTLASSAAKVGLLSTVTYFVITVTAFTFVANTIFSLATKNEVPLHHRSSMVISACIAAVAGLSYFVIRSKYEAMLLLLAPVTDAGQREGIIQRAWIEIGQFRYMDWAVTTPLLLVKIALTQNVKPREIAWPLTALIAADLFMIFTGFVGEQRVGPGDAIYAGPHYFWGTVSTLGYLVVIYILFREIGPRYAARATMHERRAFRLMALSVVTFWGVYPIGYILASAFPGLNRDWLQIAFSVADVINKTGIAVIAYLAARAQEEERVVPTENVARDPRNQPAAIPVR